jgi:protein tyrosine/serine phosphatase
MWIDLDGLANLRDVGGIPTVDGGTIVPGRLLRSDNLQSLTPADIEELLRRGLTDVVDLRSSYEVDSTGPGPLTEVPGVRIHHHSLFRESRPGIGEEKPGERPEVMPEEALPWVDLRPTIEIDNQVASIYLSYLSDRPDSIVSALRDIAGAEGATLVHCAAGKDRTGTIVALALLLAGARTEDVVADYAASSERMEGILDRLLSTDTYRDNLSGRPMSSHLTHPETMLAFLDHVQREHGSVEALLATLGWTEADTAQIRAKLRDPVRA